MFVATENANIVVINDNYFIEIKRLKTKRQHNEIPVIEQSGKYSKREKYSYRVKKRATVYTSCIIEESSLKRQ